MCIEAIITQSIVLPKRCQDGHWWVEGAEGDDLYLMLTFWNKAVSISLDFTIIPISNFSLSVI